MASSSDHADTPRRRQLVEAAGSLFRSRGFRGVTMEAIAAEARVAKATLYSYFPDKTAIFTALASHVVRMIADAMCEALAEAGDVDTRLLRGLIARHRVLFELVEGSVHARELMTAKENFARTSVYSVDVQMIAALAAVVREDAVLARSADQIAHILFDGANGVCSSARTVEETEAAITSFARPYLVGARALADASVRHSEGRRAAGSGKR